MADYDFSGLDDVLAKTPTAPTAPPVPVSAPEAAQPKYDFSSLDTPNDPAASAAKAAALFEASFRNPTEEAKKRNLSATIQRMSGEFVPPAVMDVGDAQRRADRLSADHATRASPRTSAFLSVQENADIAMQDAKTMAAIEDKANMVWGPLRDGFAEADGLVGMPRAKALSKAVLAAIGGGMQVTDTGAYFFRKLMAPAAAATSEGAAGLLQHAVEPFSGVSSSARAVGVQNPLRAVADWAAQAGADADALHKMLLGDQSQTGFWERNALNAAQSVVQSAMTMPVGLPLANALSKAAGVARPALAAFTAALGYALPGGLVQGGQAYSESRREGASVFASSARGLADTATETGFEMIPGSTFLKASKGGTENFAKAFLKAQLPEVLTEVPTTLTQNFTKWAVLDRNKGKTWGDFIDEQPAAVLDTIVTTLIAGGGQVALGAVADATQRKREENFGARLSEMAALTAQLETTRLHLPTAQAFWQEIAGDSSVFIDQAKLTETLAEAGVDIAVLPTAAAQMAEARPEGIEIPVSELMTGLANTKAADAIIQHVRMAPDAESIFEHNQPIDKQLEFFQQEATRAVAAETRTAAFNAEVKQIEDDITADLTTVGTYGKQANATQAKVAGAWYATVADKWGVTPLQIRDGWTAADGTKYPGWRPKIKGAPMQGFSHGQAMLNVGLDVGATDRAQKIDADFVKAEIEKLGVKVLSGRNVPGEYELNGEKVKELTYVPRLSRPLTEAEVNQLAAATGQEAIGHYAGGKGDLWGPNAANWGAFNPQFFKDQMGATLSGEQAAFAAQQGGLSQKKKSPKAKPIKDAAALIDAASIANASKIAATGKFDYIRDLKEQIQNAVREAAQGADLSAVTPEVRKYLTDLGTQEALAALQTNANAVGWYDIKTRQALSVVALIHPEILTDPDARFAFIYALAVTSNGQKVVKNFELAERAYSELKATGAMPSNVGAGGPAGKKVHEALARYNDLVKTFGSPAAVEEFMLTEFTAKELAEDGFGAGGENVDTVVLGAAILGPKIGNGFFANLYGVFDRLTMDRWLMRTWGRWTGTLLKDNQAAVADETKVLKALVRAVRADKESNAAMRQVFAMSVKGVVDKSLLTAKVSPWEALVKTGNFAHIGDRLRLKTTYPPLRAVMSGSPLLNELRKSGIRLYNKLDGSNEAPGGGNQRNWLRAVFSDILQSVVDSTGQKMEMADLQALLWYPEKRLYDSAKADDELEGYEDDEAPDYANAAATLARGRGVSEDAIASALANPADRPATVRPVAGGAVARELGSFADESEGADGQEEGAFYQEPSRPGAVPGPVVGVHFSKEPRGILSSSMWGTGMKGAEGDYVRSATDKRLRHRIAFYVNTGNGITPESGVGGHAHVVTLTNLYDADADALKIWRENGDERVRESAVLDAGFDGFLTRSFGSQGAVVLLGERAVQVEHMGGYARTSWDIPKNIQTEAIAAGNAVNTGKYITSLQSGFNDASPEGQAATLAKVLEGFGKPNDAETVAGFLEGRTGTEALAAILATQDVQKAVQDRAAVVPPAVLPPAKQAAQALMANKQLISGQQNVAGWQKDVARIAPDIADQIDWSKLDSDKLYWKDDIAKTLWAMGDGTKKGSFSPATLDLRLLADADLSTFLHEASHFFLAAYTDMASQPGAPKALVDEVNAILAHLFKTVQGGAVAGGDLAQNGPLLAPNGKPSKLNARQWKQVRTPEFKAWFGDWENAPANASKAVDENGEPKVYYHGSRKAGFLRFDTDGSGKTKGTGAFFTDDYQMSRGYAGGRGDDAPIYTAQEIFADPEVIDGLEIEEGVLVEVTVSSKGATAWQWYADEEAALDALELEEGEDLAAKPGYRLLRDGYEEAVGTKEEVVAYIDTQEMETEAKGIYEVFLNVRDLVELDWQDKSWDEGPTEKMWEIFDENGDIYETAYDEEERDRILADKPGYTAEEGEQSSYESTDDAARQGRDMGADGILIKDVWDTGPDGHAESGNVFVVYKDTNIKDAFKNTGAFSNEDPNILHEGGEVPAPTALPEGATPLEIWSKMSLDQQRPYHEAWAEQGEQYFMTGKAPSLALESAFRTFANWLKKIYTSVKEFVAGHTGGALHPDTAAFFDRMLATEAEIKLANEKRGFVQLFKDAAEAGMTERGFADYTALTDEQREDAEAMLRTRSLRDMKWLQASRDKVIAALQSDAKEARAILRAEVEKELSATPLRKAMRWLKTGELTAPGGDTIKVLEGNKLQKADVEALFPAGALADRPDLSRLRGMTAAEGLAPDLVAEMFDGFTSGEDLVRQLAAAPKFNDEVEALTNQRMLEEHSDLVDPDAIAKAADAAIHNDAHIRLAATELAALNSRIGSVAALTRAAKEYARQLIETKTSKTLKPWQFAAADTRARKAAAKALRKGERDEAATQMRTALVNAAATKLAYDAEDDIKKITDRFKKIAGYKDTDSAFKSRDAELVNAVRAILADFGIGTKGKSAREYLAVVQQHNPDLAAVLSDTIDAVTENAKDWQLLKISELRDLAEEIDGLWFLAKRSKQIEIDGKVMPLHEAQQALYDRLDAIGIPDRVPGEGSAVTPAEKRGILFDRFVGALRRVEAWVGAKDGTLTGPFRTYMWNPIRDAADAYRADKAKYLKAYRDLLTPIAPTLTRRLIEAPEIGYVFGKDEGGMGKLELLHAILHTGNESNKRKLLLGRGWATEKATGATELNTSKWDAFVQRMHDEGVLTKADYDFAQGVWNLLDSMKPLAQKAHRDVFGKYFAEVTANEFTNQFGTYAGGYVPAMTDPLIVRDAELNKLREGEEGNMAYAFPTTAKGFTKSRVEYNRPLKLDLRTLSQHIDKVLLFSHMTRPVNDVRRVMSGKSVAQALGRVDPQAYNTLIMPWLNRAAKQVVETPTPGREGLGRFWSVVRARAGMAAMFANVANSVQQITGLSLAAVRVRPGLLMDAMAKYAMNPATFAEHVTGKSSYMATRLENEVSLMSSQINEILLNPSVYESAKEWTSRHAYFMQSAVDSVIGPVVWLGGYNQAIEAGLSEADAVRAGDSAVRETQGSQEPEDIAAFETGSAFYRMFVQFAGYFNMNANLLGTEFVKLSRDMGLKKGAGRGLYLLTFGFLAPAIVGELIMQLFKGGPDDDDKDGEYLDDWLTAIFGYGVLRYATAMVPGIGPAVNATVNTLNNKPYDDRISTAPAISMIEAAVKAPIDLYKAITDGNSTPSKAIKEIATLISMTVGVPASAVAKPVGYGADVAAGRVAPTSIPDAVRGTITGTASPASKQ